MLSVKKVSFHYEKSVPLLENVSFDVSHGSVLGILGHNGSGKTTLLRLIARLLTPALGQISLDGKNIDAYGRFEFLQRLGALIEAPAFYDHLSLQDNLQLFNLYRKGTNWKKLLQYIDRLGMTSELNRRTGKFSTGMRQRSALALAMYHSPDLLLLDEPTTGLDPDGIILTRSLFKEAKDRGASVIVTGHHLSEIEKIADHFIILKNGELIFQGPMSAARDYRDLEDFYLSVTQPNA